MPTLGGLVAAARATPVAASAWPSQPVRLICPFAAGGPTDVAARLVADGLTNVLPQRVLVENRTGSGVVVGTETVAKAPRDGYTILYSTIAHAVLRPLFSSLSFDPVADFRPVALVGTVPMLLMVNKDVPARNLQELIALFRDKPGRYDYGSSGAGGAVHLATELFLRQAGDLKVNHIPYRGSAPAMPDLLNGNLTMFLNVASDGIASVQSGATRALAVSSAQRLPQLPDVPTFAEAGLPGYEAYTAHAFRAGRHPGGGRERAEPGGEQGGAHAQCPTALHRAFGPAALRQHARQCRGPAPVGDGEMGAAGPGERHHGELRSASALSCEGEPWAPGRPGRTARMPLAGRAKPMWLVLRAAARPRSGIALRAPAPDRRDMLDEGLASSPVMPPGRGQGWMPPGSAARSCIRSVLGRKSGLVQKARQGGQAAPSPTDRTMNTSLLFIADIGLEPPPRFVRATKAAQVECTVEQIRREKRAPAG
ncbi:tripartite tricarboxylate transporter substrate-binding protein [Teichococcus aestuarii]